MEEKFENKFLEERLVQALIIDTTFAEQMLDILDLKYYSVDYLREINQLIFNFQKQYKTFPSFQAIVMMVKEEVNDKVLQSQMVHFLARIKKEPLVGDLEYIKEQSLDFCKKRSLMRALEHSLSLISEKRYEEISSEIQRALQAGAEKNIGHVFKDQFELRRTKEQVAAVIPTPWPEFNKVIRGGLWAGKLGVVCAPTGVGKTHALIDISSHACMQGHNVVYYTLELDEIDTGNRCDARISGVPIDTLDEHKDLVRGSIENLCKGQLVIKSYPMKAITLNTLKSHYNNLVLRGMKPDLIVIDYADLLKSTENYKDKRLNEESVYEELRGWAKEIKTPMWTATQTNRAGLDADIITLQYIAECFGKAMISDLFLTLNRKKDGPTPEFGNAFIAKSRLGPDGVKFLMQIDTTTSTIRLASEEGVGAPDDSSGDDDALKRRLLARFKDFQRKASPPKEIN